MLSKILQILPMLFQSIAWLINKYQEKQLEEKYEKVRNDSASEWVDGFGVRRDTEDDHPTETHSGK